MKFFAIIFLATVSYIGQPDKTENLYSYQLQFSNYDECVKFYVDWQDKLLNGLLDHGRRKYGDIQIDYLSCAEVEINPNSTSPNVIGQKSLYERQ